MATYAIYKYLFDISKQGHLFSKETGKSAFDEAQRHFADILKEDIAVPGGAVDSKEEATFYIEPYLVRDDIIFLLVCNEKTNRIRDRLDEREITSHPGCFVIIDNRPGVTMLAIEKNNAFYSKTEKIRKILLYAFNLKLEQLGLTMEINARIRPGTFWEVVDEQCTKLKDVIKKVSFNFPNPNKIGPVDASAEAKKNLSYISRIIGAANAAKGTLVMHADEKEKIALNQKVEDFAEMVRLCEFDGYDISVHFKRYGVYRFGAEAQVYMILQDDVRDHFLQGVTVLGLPDEQPFELYQWLEDINKLVQTCSDEIPANKERKGKNK